MQQAHESRSAHSSKRAGCWCNPFKACVTVQAGSTPGHKSACVQTVLCKACSDMSVYARYFKQQLLSDCNLIISWPRAISPHDGDESMECCSVTDEQPEDGAVEDADIIRDSISFPAHQLVLFQSSHFEAQVLLGSARTDAFVTSRLQLLSSKRVLVPLINCIGSGHCCVV